MKWQMMKQVKILLPSATFEHSSLCLKLYAF